MKFHLVFLSLFILSSSLMGSCAPTAIPPSVPSVTVPTFALPSIAVPTFIVPTLKSPSIEITLVPGGTNTPEPQATAPSSGSAGINGFGSTARLLFFGLVALIGVIVVIAMFMYYFRRRPDQ